MPAAAPASDHALLRVLRGEKVARPPVWIMRQAGRYLAEYKAVRARFPGFLAFCRDPDAVAEVTVQPVDLVGVDAAIVFSDILVLLPPLGLELDFHEGRGPVVANPLATEADIARLPAGDLNGELEYVFEGLRRSRKALAGRVPLLGFAGGPFTVASYMVEGKTSKELARLKALMYSAPGAFDSLLAKLAEVTGHYLAAQADAGAQALVIMDSWAGHLSPADYVERVFPHTRALVERVRADRPGVPILHYANGAGGLLPHLVRLGCDAIGLDWRTDLAQALRDHPGQVFQGNPDPCLLYAPEAEIRRAVAKLKAVVGDRPHVYNLGHGILPDTPVAHARAFVAAVHGD